MTVMECVPQQRLITDISPPMVSILSSSCILQDHTPFSAYIFNLSDFHGSFPSSYTHFKFLQSYQKTKIKSFSDLVFLTAFFCFQSKFLSDLFILPFFLSEQMLNAYNVLGSVTRGMIEPQMIHIQIGFMYICIYYPYIYKFISMYISQSKSSNTMLCQFLNLCN